jgi:hypothetical protein
MTPNVLTFTGVTDTTFIVPSGVTSILAEARGGGAGGGTATNGGQGGYIRTQVPVTPGDSWRVIVGAGGGAGAMGNPSGAISNNIGGDVFVAFPGNGPGSGGGSDNVAPAVALDRTPGSDLGGVPGVAGSGGAPGQRGEDGFVILYLGN